MQEITIKNYLTAKKLKSIMKDIVPNEYWLGTEVQVSDVLPRSKWDMSFKNHKGKRVNVEFDGNTHYSNIDTIRRDIDKNKEAARLGEYVVRIPYWVQLTNESFYHYFQERMFLLYYNNSSFQIESDTDTNYKEVTIVQDFPHGFIDKKAVLPSDFCELGIERFIDELDSLPDNIRQNVLHSLWRKVGQKGNIKLTMPRRIWNYVYDHYDCA